MSFGRELLNCALHAMINLGGISSACRDGALAMAGRVSQIMGRNEARPPSFDLQFRCPALKMVALSRSGILPLCIWESGWKPLLRYEPHH
jgi:hypothetical protein